MPACNLSIFILGYFGFLVLFLTIFMSDETFVTAHKNIFFLIRIMIKLSYNKNILTFWEILV